MFSQITDCIKKSTECCLEVQREEMLLHLAYLEIAIFLRKIDSCEPQLDKLWRDIVHH